MLSTPNTRLSLLTSALLTAALLPLVLGCAPDRSDDDDDGGGGNTLPYALFTVIDYGDFQSTQQGRLVLTDAATVCEDLSWGGGLRWWELSPDMNWVELYLTRGVEVDSWSQEFQSSYAWQMAGEFDYLTATFFSGSVGVGDASMGDDDDDEPIDPPTPIGRGETGQIGYSAEHETDSLVISSYNLEGLVSGFIQSTIGNYSFSATHCGITYDEGPVGVGGSGTAAGDPPTDG